MEATVGIYDQPGCPGPSSVANSSKVGMYLLCKYIITDSYVHTYIHTYMYVACFEASSPTWQCVGSINMERSAMSQVLSFKGQFPSQAMRWWCQKVRCRAGTYFGTLCRTLTDSSGLPEQAKKTLTTRHNTKGPASQGVISWR